MFLEIVWKIALGAIGVFAKQKWMAVWRTVFRTLLFLAIALILSNVILYWSPGLGDWADSHEAVWSVLVAITAWMMDIAVTRLRKYSEKATSHPPN